jgi:CheY-like chemotaxis protein
MLNSVAPAVGTITFEALPILPGRRHAVRSSTGEPPEDDEGLIAGSRQFSASEQARLPRVLRGVRVLVVDDDEDTVELFATALAACGADVVTATSAPDALRVVTDRSPHVVVTDIAMPGADGYWLVREIRRLADDRVNTPVVAVTAFGREHFRARALAAGFADHLEKPVDPKMLCVAVARAAAR